MNVQEVRDNCSHEPSTNPRATGTDCGKCGFPIPPWYLTEFYARQFYAAIGVPDLADHAIARLRMGGRDYEWTAYLERDNAGEGVDELVDTDHYALFDTLRSYLLEQRGLDPARAELARRHLHAGAALATEVVRHFQAAQELLKD